MCSLDSAPWCLFSAPQGGDRWALGRGQHKGPEAGGEGWQVMIQANTAQEGLSSGLSGHRAEMAWPLGSCALACLSLSCKRSSLLKLDRPWSGASPLALSSAPPSPTPGKSIPVLPHECRDAACAPGFFSVQHGHILYQEGEEDWWCSGLTSLEENRGNSNRAGGPGGRDSDGDWSFFASGCLTVGSDAPLDLTQQLQARDSAAHGPGAAVLFQFSSTRETAHVSENASPLGVYPLMMHACNAVWLKQWKY